MLDKPKGELGPKQTAVFSMRVRDFMRPLADALAIRAGTKCAEMIAHLKASKASCAVVVDAAGRPVGIITEKDIARRITFCVDGDTPVDGVMTTPILTIERRDYLYHAIGWMRRHKLRHMPVVNRAGQLMGMLYLHDALAVAADRLMGQIDRLTHESSLTGMKQVRAAQVELAEELFADGLPAPEIQQVISQINNDMYRRIGEANLQQMKAEGWGDPPVKAATIVMGSGGRGENYLFPDQDNGFILEDYPDSEHNRIDAFFIELAERLCRDLNEIGIPYCNGYCMAVNPLWRKTLTQWGDQINQWSRKSNFVTIRLADIFFDFQPVWGQRELGLELRHKVTEIVRHNYFFLRQMFQDQADHNVALGFFGGFMTEKEKREFRGQVNLKYTGTIPLVEGIRLLALREGVEATSTLERIGALHENNVLTLTEHEDLTSAFHLITDILLRKQVFDYKAGRRVNYYIAPKALARRDRLMLLDSLKVINNLRKRVRLEFTADIF
jgi:signal-transduction protein with cAMP-binding, CBS, and nucleotidyltransferase domain